MLLMKAHSRTAAVKSKRTKQDAMMLSDNSFNQAKAVPDSINTYCFPGMQQDQHTGTHHMVVMTSLVPNILILGHRRRITN